MFRVPAYDPVGIAIMGFCVRRSECARSSVWREQDFVCPRFVIAD
jgi:hypothetical protein